MDYNTLIKLKQTYDITDRSIIAQNVRELLNRHNIKVYELETVLNLSKHSLYAYTKVDKGNKMYLYNLLTLAAYFHIDPFELLNE